MWFANRSRGPSIHLSDPLQPPLPNAFVMIAATDGLLAIYLRGSASETPLHCPLTLFFFLSFVWLWLFLYFLPSGSDALYTRGNRILMSAIEIWYAAPRPNEEKRKGNSIHFPKGQSKVNPKAEKEDLEASEGRWGEIAQERRKKRKEWDEDWECISH